MPVYVFKCKDCGQTFDRLRPIWERDKTIICPGCASDNARRKFGIPFVGRRAAYQEPAETHQSAEGTVGMGINDSTGIVLDNVKSRNFDVGIKATNSQLHGRNVSIKGSRVGVDHENSDVEMDGLGIE